MGCDIHTMLVVARKGDDRDYRIVGSGVLQGRDYALFAILAGVRNRDEWKITPIAEPRGLPVGFEVDPEDLYRLGDHSFSWLSPDELRKAAEAYGRHEQAWRPEEKVKAIRAVADYLEAEAEEGDTPRFVFGFDS